MAKVALVLLNMGGPNNLDEVEIFLKNMFADKNILTMKSSLMRKIVGGMIVFNRTEKAQEIYRSIGGKSPIVGHTKKLVSKLQKMLGSEVVVDFSMRYTPPFAQDVLERLEEKKVDKIYLIPLYPHYSTTTTKSSLEDFEEKYRERDTSALLVEIKHFFENKTYNKSILKSIQKKVNGFRYEGFDIIFSAHGLPKKIIENGDVYENHITRHIDILTKMMKKEKMHFNKVHLAYQSKVGPLQWLGPSLDDKLKNIRNKGVIIFPISFAIDNSETDYELSIEYAKLAKSLGFTDYRVCKCPNSSELFVKSLSEIFQKMK